MEVESLVRILERFRKQPLRTAALVFLVSVIAVAGIWFSGYLGEKGRQSATPKNSATPENSVATGKHHILPVESTERDYLLMSPGDRSIADSI